MRRKLLAPLVLALLAAVGLAACGGTRTVTVVAPPHVNPRSSMVAPKGTSPTAIGGHLCSPQNQTHNCTLANQPPPPLLALKLAPFGATAAWYGLDMAFSGISPGEAQALGAHFVVSYLSSYNSKNWTLSEWNALHAEHIATVLNFENSGVTTGGYAAGQYDGHQALDALARLGIHSTRPIIFSTDEDATWSSVAAYYQGVASVIGKSRTGVYGSYQVIEGAAAAGYPSRALWQTYAWSNGALSSHACLYQYLNGATFDNDKSLCKDFSQTPAPSVKPPKRKLTGTANFSGAFSSSWAWGVHGVKGSVKGSAGYAHGIAAEGQVGRSHRFRIQGMKATAPPIAGKAIKVYWPVKQLFPFGAHFTFNKGAWDLWGSRGRLPVFPKGCDRLSFQIYMATHGRNAFKPEIRKMVCDAKPLG